MSRFSPTVQPQPSWTNALAEGVGNLGDALMQRRAFNLQKQKQDFDQNIQTQNEARENAQAGYTPAANGAPASYDPTKSGAYSIWGARNEGLTNRALISAGSRTDAANIRGKFNLQAIADRYGTYAPGPDGQMVYTPGVQTESQEAVQQPKLDFQQGWHDQLGNQFSRKLTETTRHDQAMEARPVGNRTSISSDGGFQTPTPALAKQISANYTALSKPQPMVDKNGAVLQKLNPPLPPKERMAEAVHRVNIGLAGAGADTLANSASMPESALARDAKARAASKVNPDAAAGVERDGTAASKAPAPVHGAQTPLHPGTNKSQQELHSTSQGLPASPTDDNAPHPNAKAFTDMSALYQKHQATIDGRTDLSPAGKAQLKKQLSDAYNQQMTTIAQQK